MTGHPAEKPPIVGAAHGSAGSLSRIRLPRHLNYREGILEVEGWSISTLLARHRTPAVIFSAAALREYAARCRAAFNPAVRVHVSYKACYYGPVLRILQGEAIDVEVTSLEEFRLARALNVPPRRIGWNPVALTDDEAKLAVTEPLAYLGVNTRTDLHRLAAAARRRGAEVSVVLRVYPVGVHGRYVQRGSRLGFDVGDGTALEVAREVLSTPGVSLMGIHCHVCTEEVSPDQHVAVLRSLITFTKRLHTATGHQLRLLGLGGGIAAPRTLARAGSSIEAFSSKINREICNLPWRMSVILEPGRYLSSDAAVGLASIISETTCAGRRWWIVDLGTQYLVPFGGRQFEVIPVVRSQKRRIRVSIGDRLSSFSGVICEDIEIPAARPGDVVAILSAGAYTGSAAQRFMFGLPEILLIDGDNVSRIASRDGEHWLADLAGVPSPQRQRRCARRTR